MLDKRSEQKEVRPKKLLMYDSICTNFKNGPDSSLCWKSGLSRLGLGWAEVGRGGHWERALRGLLGFQRCLLLDLDTSHMHVFTW